MIIHASFLIYRDFNFIFKKKSIKLYHLFTGLSNISTFEVIYLNNRAISPKIFKIYLYLARLHIKKMKLFI